MVRIPLLTSLFSILVLLTSTANASLTFGPDFAGNYIGNSLGSPSGLPGPAGGLTLLAGDPNTLLIGGNANTPNGAIYSVALIRGTGGHITGFGGSATLFASAAYIDGGLAYGPDGVLFYTRYNEHKLGQIKPGSNTTDRVDSITGFGAPGNSVGSLAFVPEGFAGEGQLKIVTFQQAQFGTLPISPDGNGTFAPGSGALEATLSGGPEGIAYVKGTNSGFGVDSLLVAEYTSGKVGAYQLDANGNPIPGTRRDFITNLTSAEGAFIDPVTGDFLFSTFQAGSEVFVVQGFVPPDGVVPEASGLMIWVT